MEERDYRSAILSIIRTETDNTILKSELEKYHDNDIASVLDELTAEERDKLLRAIGIEAMSAIVSYMEDASEYLSELDVKEVADIIEQMDADDAVEILDDLDDETRTEVLEQIDDTVIKKEIELIDSYGEDEFGSKMSTNFIVVKRDVSIKAATKTLISEAAENDNIYTIFVTDDGVGFYGAIDLKDLIVARSSTELESLICTTFPYVFDNESISENIERLRGYSEDLIPVLSHRDMSVLGVITARDITDIVDDELEDDYAKLAALGSEQDEDESLLGSIRKRVPWLVALLFMGLAVSAVVGLFENVVDSLPMIVAFQSLILGMAGNVGTQSLAVTVRALGGEETRFKDQLIMIAKETRVALLNGTILGIVAFLIVGGYLLIPGELSTSFALTAATCVGLSMCFAMMISGFTGATIPIVLYRFGVDPAVASGPLITTVNDLVAVVSYYSLAWLLLLNII